MPISIPQIGFDRFVDLTWADMAMRVRAGLSSPDELDALLDQGNMGAMARRKTRTILNRLWLEPHPSLTEFADRAVGLRNEQPDVPAVVFCWGMAMAAYPYFGQVAEVIGRLSALHGDCTTAEIHRRMRERFGERETIRRVTDWVIQTQVNWGAIIQIDKRKRVVRENPLLVASDQVPAWLVEAALRSSNRALAMSALGSLPALYPFKLGDRLPYVISSSPHLEVREQGFHERMVGLPS